jgi:hypothetical protein
MKTNNPINAARAQGISDEDDEGHPFLNNKQSFFLELF